MLDTLRGDGIDCLLTNFNKDGTPQAPTSVHQCLYHICTHRGRVIMGLKAPVLGFTLI